MAFSAAQAARKAHGDLACNCGPTCSCILCLDHPYNTATMEHIASEFGQMMTDGAGFSPEGGNHGTPEVRPDVLAQAWRPAPNCCAVPNSVVPATLDDSVLAAHQSPPQPGSDIFLNPADFQMFNFAFPPLDDVDQYDAQPVFNYENYEAMPEFDMTGMCGGIPEGCPCGDDCACIGCQVHGKPSNTPDWI